MYTPFRRSVATILLFSILLQGCGNPGWEIADDKSPRGASAKTCHPSKVKKRSKSLELATAASFTEGSKEPEVGCAPVRGDAPSRKRSTEALAKVSNTPSLIHPVHRLTMPTLPKRTSTSRPFHSPRPLIQTKVPRKHAASKPLLVALDRVSIAGSVHREGDQALALTTPSSLQAPLSTGLLDASWANRNYRCQPQSHYGAMHSLKATECKEPYTKSATNLAFQTYPSSQGHQVSFKEANGKWLAQVQDGWGREQCLPVVCATLQSPERAIQILSSKAPGQHKYWVHVLETNQPLWAPRVLYVGRVGIRGGMEKEERHVQEGINAMHASSERNNVTVSEQIFQLHETADKEPEKDTEECQEARRKRLSERRRQNILTNSAARLASIRNTHAVDHVQKEDEKSDKKGGETQALPPNETPIAWHHPFAARAAPTSEIANWLQRNLQLYVRSASKGSLLAQTQATRAHVTSAQKEENTKMPSPSRVTTFTTLAAAQEAVEAYLARWRLGIPSGRAALREQGKDILKGVEVLKKTTKRSYRQQVLGFETHDIDPLVWHMVLRQQQEAKEQLKALRSLRTQLLDVCQIHGEALQAAGIRITTNAAEGACALYSSDEEAQQLSDQSRRNNAAFVAGIGKVLQGHIEELLALVDDTMGTTIVHYIALLSSIPELPDLLGDYVEAFLHEADEERRAELLGSLLTEVILQFVPLPKDKKTRLNASKHKLGKAAQQVTSQRTNQLNTRVRKSKALERMSKLDQKK
jgi:hypothetical protein